MSAVRRRAALVALAAAPLLARADALAALRSGAVAVLLRHAATDAGIGDPPGFVLDDCATQRNLSDSGRAQARRAGEWFKARRLTPSRVRSSPWCRCIDTARLAFGSPEVWAPLASTFAEPERRDAQSAALREALLSLPRGRFEIWVTHQININGLARASLPMGHAIVVRGERSRAGTIEVRNLGSSSFE